MHSLIICTRTFKPFNINLFLFKYSRVSLLCQVMFHLSLYMYRQMLSTSYISFLFLYDVYWMRSVLPCYLTWCLLNARACNLFTRTFKLFDIIFFFLQIQDVIKVLNPPDHHKVGSRMYFKFNGMCYFIEKFWTNILLSSSNTEFWIYWHSRYKAKTVW